MHPMSANLTHCMSKDYGLRAILRTNNNCWRRWRQQLPLEMVVSRSLRGILCSEFDSWS
jgi:hypothetical protein